MLTFFLSCRKIYIIEEESEVTTHEEVLTNGNTATTILTTTDVKKDEVRRKAFDSESKDVNQFVWRQVALAFDSLCGTVLCCAMLGNFMYALISFLK